MYFLSSTKFTKIPSIYYNNYIKPRKVKEETSYCYSCYYIFRDANRLNHGPISDAKSKRWTDDVMFLYIRTFYNYNLGLYQRWLIRLLCHWEGWKWEGSKCVWIKKQIELFHIHLSNWICPQEDYYFRKLISDTILKL